MDAVKAAAQRRGLSLDQLVAEISRLPADWHSAWLAENFDHISPSVLMGRHASKWSADCLASQDGESLHRRKNDRASAAESR
jgi:hypothetical protein